MLVQIAELQIKWIYQIGGEPCEDQSAQGRRKKLMYFDYCSKKSAS